MAGLDMCVTGVRMWPSFNDTEAAFLLGEKSSGKFIAAPIMVIY